MAARKVPDVGAHQVYAGDDWTLEVARKIRVGAGNDFIPDDLSGWTDWRAVWKPHHKSAEEVVLDVLITLPNKIAIHAGPASTRIIAEDKVGVFDVQAIRGSETKTFFKGTTFQEEDVTR